METGVPAMVSVERVGADGVRVSVRIVGERVSLVTMTLQGGAAAAIEKLWARERGCHAPASHVLTQARVRGDAVTFERTCRGFAMVKVKDDRGCICRVQRSSSWPLDRVWIFCDDPHGVYTEDPSPHLSADQARQVAAALIAFANEEDKEVAPDGQ